VRGAWRLGERFGDDLPVLLGLAGVAAYAAFAADAYALRLLTVAGVYALLTLGYQFVFGLAGALSLAQGCFFGLGAYAAGILGSRYGWGFDAAFPLAVLLPVALAALVAAPVLRLESHYFALATLGVGQVMLLGAVNWENVTGGANGLPGVPAVSLFGVTVGRGLPMLVLVWGLVAAGWLIFRAFAGGRRGAAYRTLRETPLAAAAIGIDGGMLRLRAFLASAAFGGAAGALHVHTIGVVSPEALEFPVMVACLAMAVIGGRGRAAGAVIGALLLVHLPEWFRFLERYYLVAYGVGVLAVIVFVPNGLAGLADSAWRRLARPAAPVPPRAAARIPLAARLLPEGAAPVLEIAGVIRRFGGVTAVDGVGFAIGRGEILGLIGPNGSGKSTLANLIAGTDRPDAGSIRLAGREVGGAPAHARARLGIARSFQATSLVDGMTVLETVALARATAGRPGNEAEAEAHAMALLDRLGLAAEAGRPCGDLPQGARRRVEVARALALDPLLLVLDEPAAGLDAAERAALAAQLRDLARASGPAMLVIEHDMGFLAPLADRLVCLDEGRLIAIGPPEAVRRDPAVLAVYLGEGGLGEGGPVESAHGAGGS